MRRIAALSSLLLIAVSCGSGKSIVTAGRKPTVPTVVTSPAPVTLAPGVTLPVGETLPPVDTTIAPTTTAALLDTLPNCPTEALASATGPVELTFWHGMNGPLADELQKLTDAYNTSQSKVHVTLIEGCYEQTIDKYLQAGQAYRPDLVQMPEYMVQQMVDSQSVVPADACVKSSGYDTSAFLATGLGAYATQGVQWSIPFNISNPVLFYNKKMFIAA
ncbi:MAG: sn-glycerol 3-phosphate transport system substrate-binding protein, partial [Ilumatobacteraceae bacterium]